MEHEDLLREIHRVTLENNKMLHAMRRNAFWGGMFKLALYAIFIIVPAWLYYVYLGPMVGQALGTMQKLQGTSAQAGAQLSGLQELLQQYSSLLGGSN